MNKEMYDKILTLMAIDMGYEKEFGVRYIKQEIFDESLLKAGVGEPDLDYIEKRLKVAMNKLKEEISQ